LIFNPHQARARIERLKSKADKKVQAGDVGIVTAFPKHPSPPGIAYSRNFARALRDGRMAIQTRD
jgi:hypothetical protein